jgi:hypothetical protein
MPYRIMHYVKSSQKSINIFTYYTYTTTFGVMMLIKPYNIFKFVLILSKMIRRMAPNIKIF